MARLKDPGLVAVYDQGNDDGTVFLAMELESTNWLLDPPPDGVKEGSTPNALALSADGRFLGLHATATSNVGAYTASYIPRFHTLRMRLTASD